MGRVRTFIALHLTEDVQGRLASAQDTLAGAEARVRWVPRQNIHLTLKFLGGVEDRMLGEVCSAAAEAAEQVEPFRFDVAGVTAMPPAGALRLIWAGVCEPTGALAELHDLLSGACEGLGFKGEQRGFRPHLTLGRFKGGKNADALRAAAAEMADAAFGSVDADELVVYGSVLGPTGPTYTALSHARLGEK